METTLGRVTVEGGLLKQRREPVLLLLNPALDGRTVSCDWLFTHPGLVPGTYELTNGWSVVIPPEHCASEGKATHSTTLEVAR